MRPTGFVLSRLCDAGNGQGSGHDRDHEQLAVRPHLAASSSRSQHWPASHQHQAGHDHRIISLGSRPIRAMLTILANCPFLDSANLLKICNQTRRRSVEMRRVYRRDAELFNGTAGAGLLQEGKRRTNTNCRP